MTDKDDKFVLMNMDDKRSKKIAEVLGNKTCKKIIDYLTYNSEKSEEDIANALDMKINTAEYNLKKLLDAGLVEKVKKFFWSKKGKKIPLYKLARKHIVISPKSTRPNLTALKTIIPVILAMALIITLIALFIPSSKVEEIQGLKKFSSMQELETFLEQNRALAEIYGAGISRASEGTTVATAEAVTGAVDSSQKAGATDYSQTNIQVKGVDEPDIVKNDGKYIYVVSGNKIVILNAYPAESMEILSEINITNPTSMFINEDKLIIFSNEYNEEQNAVARIYDVSDRSDPKLEKEVRVEGNYLNARMIDDYVYLLASKYTGFDNIVLPFISVNGVKETVAVRDISYLPYPDTNYQFTNILALNVKDGSFNSETYLLGSTYTIYVSEDNLYLTHTKRINQQDYYGEMIEEVILPILPGDLKKEVKDMLSSDEPFYEKISEINEIVSDYSNSLAGKAKANFDSEFAESMEDFSVKLQKRTEQTIIHKIKVDEDSIEYVTNGQVPGRVLNQFSMDEYDKNFRIATTTGNTWGSRQSSLNHLYILDEDLEITGKIEDLAKGERIYSVRFMQERAYVVTFRQVDPLFVFDLSDPENPEVLGQLKVTGFSSYLHPYDENHIIGIGKEATPEGRVTGVKIALFYVSDVENPIEKAKYEVEGKWSNSNALYDHKAFLFDKSRELLVLPMSYSEEWTNTQGIRKYDHWQGAFVFNINEDEISLRGKIDHKEDNEEQGYYYGPYAVQRSLYMDDILYTISGTMIKANDLDDLDELNKIDLPYEERYYVATSSRGIAVAEVAVKG